MNSPTIGKTAAIFHGYGDSPESVWIPYLKKELENRGYETWVPQLPGGENPTLADQLPFVLVHNKFGPESIIVAHSAGCPLTLSVLENLKTPIAQAILVAGFAFPLPGDVAPNKILQKVYDWEKIKSNVKDLIIINSDNDPWGCDDKQGRFMFEYLGGTHIIKHGEGHFGSNTHNQPYKEFPFLAKLIND